MHFKTEKFGKNPYNCTLITGIHPNEDAGSKIFDLLRKNSGEMNFTLITIEDKKKDSGKYNLNRLFNLSNSAYFPLMKLKNKKEYFLIGELHKEIANYELVIDIHSMNFEHPPYWIVVNTTALLERSIIASNINNVLILNYKNSLIATAKNAMAIEIGYNEGKRNFKNIYLNLRNIILNFDAYSNEHFENKKLNYYFSIGEFKNDFVDILTNNIKDFKLVNRGDLLGYKGNNKVYSPLNFYPLWTKKTIVDKNYPVVCHILKKINEDFFF